MSVCKLFDLVEVSVKMQVERSWGGRHKDTTRTPRPPTPGRAQLGPSATQAVMSLHMIPSFPSSGEPPPPHPVLSLEKPAHEC